MINNKLKIFKKVDVIFRQDAGVLTIKDHDDGRDLANFLLSGIEEIYPVKDRKDRETSCQELIDSRLFDQNEIEHIKNWMHETPYGYGMSPNQVSKIVNSSRSNLQELCNSNKIEAYYHHLCYFISPQTIIKLRKKYGKPVIDKLS